MKYDIPCVIFAGGKSSRMGKDKSLLQFLNGKSLIRYQYDRLSKIFNKVYISSKTPKFDFEAPLILDSSTIYAPTPAFLDIFEYFKEFFAIAVDSPFVDKKVIDTLIQTAKENPKADAIIAKTDFPHPLIGIYRKSILPLLEKAIQEKNYKLNAILRQADTKFVTFDEEEKFFNINYPQDFTRAKNMV